MSNSSGEHPFDVAITGAGYTGLMSGYLLSKQGLRCAVFESKDHPGGMAATFPYYGTRLEEFYHHLFTGDRLIVDLFEELGLADTLMPITSRMGFFIDGKIWDFGTPQSLLRFKPLSWLDKVRFGLGALALRRVDNWKSLEGTTAMEGLQKYFGSGPTRVVWEPLMRGKFGPACDQVSLVWIWGKIKLRGQSRSKGGAKETLLYPRGSFEVFTSRLVREIEKAGGSVCTGEGVERIETASNPTGDGRCVSNIVTSRGTYPCRAVLHTPDPGTLARICPELPETWKEKAAFIKHVGVACLILTLRQSFSRIYWLNIGDRSIPFGGTMEQTNLVVTDTYGGKTPLYVSNYVYTDDPIYNMPVDELIDFYLPHLQKINPRFSKDWIEDAHLFHHPAAQPVIPCHYSQHILPHSTPIDGLFLAHISQIYPEDRGTNYSMKLARSAASLVTDHLKG